ncbi:hypothetical protein ruthe_02180 [Rubellimicrobium thermophilum DSM 16684]|uniref:Uncharacterized protein n=1 Tax=Rubellimicrobium thermophilum DSM 16684 TaxID=1123069 RepID=S9S2T2_9RHOB|nr:hypothetical protein ruthe_02180 [Rubellimicrobium thermophilum DSM 16684]
MTNALTALVFRAGIRPARPRRNGGPVRGSGRAGRPPATAPRARSGRALPRPRAERVGRPEIFTRSRTNRPDPASRTGSAEEFPR